jgi:hypothetical protein
MCLQSPSLYPSNILGYDTDPTFESRHKVKELIDIRYRGQNFT